MSKSLKGAKHALERADIMAEVQEMAEGTDTAPDADRTMGCQMHHIGASIIFRAEASSQAVLFVPAGSNRFDPRLVARLAGAMKADFTG